MGDLSLAGGASFERAASAIEAHSDRVHTRLIAAVWQACLLYEREVKERTPKGATHALMGSIAAQQPFVSATAIEGHVGTALVYAESVELGTKPHFPPVAPIADWARAKLGLTEDEAERVAYMIARKISKHGTKGAHMFTDALAATEEQIIAIIKSALTEA